MNPQTSGLQSQRTLINAKPGKQEIDSILGVYIMKQRSNVLGWGVFFILALFIFQCGGGGGGGDADPPDKPQGLAAVEEMPRVTRLTIKPRGLTAAASSGQITLTWMALPDITYNLFHSTTPDIDVDAANVMKIPNVTSGYTHTGLTNRTTYYYRLTAVNASGASEPSDEVPATPHPQITISAGFEHTCAVVDGAAKCWGRSRKGEVGSASVGTGTERQTPIQVDGLTSGVTQISAGEQFSCASVSGAAWCWGDNTNGRIGDGTTVDRNTPVAVNNLTSGVTQISTGNAHTCAVVSGAAWCWGDNTNGRIGDGTTVGRNTPVAVSNLTSGVTQISTGNSHSCALADGAVWCWGAGNAGQLGNAGRTGSNIPVAVNTLTSGVTQISLGRDHSCAVANGAAWCWGWGGSGEQGSGSNASRLSPARVGTLTSGVTQISGGRYHTCAVVNGAAWCWGGLIPVYIRSDRSNNGQLGNGGTTGSFIPVQVDGLTSGVTQISAGNEHTCAVVNGYARCWGNGGEGRIGDGMTTQRNTPVQVDDDIYD